MPYCLACGTKTDFEVTDCPSCGEAISQRIDLPADDAPATESDSVDDLTVAGEETGETATDASEVGTEPDGPSPFSDMLAVAFAITYPVRGGYSPVVIGGVLQFFATVFLFPALLTAGYAFRLAGAAARGQTERPALDNYGQLLADGLKTLLVSGLYGVVLLVGGLVAAVASVVNEPVGLAVGILVVPISLYPVPASLAVYAATDDAQAAFSRRYTGRLCASRAYLQTWLLMVACLVVISIVGALSVITIVGPFVVQAWGVYALGALWGSHYRSAVAAGTVPPASDDPVP
ncbi:hypothetical protein BRC91_04910 [Halobacteriales archaeon QS_4_62_28]|nr:MAG: hypothetical protein BRC91_04910 [Halobacteriales archaeon QS_4_62_28]